jgi:transposase
MAAKNPGGRPTKLTKELQAKIVQAIEAGNYIETAAAYAGVDKVSLYAWMKKGHHEPENGLHREFLNAVQKALAAAEVRDVTLLAAAAEESWQAAAWRLERKFPDRWGRRDTVTVLQRLAKELDALSDDELLAIAVPDSAGDRRAAVGSGTPEAARGGTSGSNGKH